MSDFNNDRFLVLYILVLRESFKMEKIYYYY